MAQNCETLDEWKVKVYPKIVKATDAVRGAKAVPISWDQFVLIHKSLDNMKGTASRPRLCLEGLEIPGIAESDPWVRRDTRGILWIEWKTPQKPLIILPKPAQTHFCDGQACAACGQTVTDGVPCLACFTTNGQCRCHSPVMYCNPTCRAQDSKKHKKVCEARKQCAGCGRLCDQGLHKCSACHTVRYCNEQCQKRHWPTHQVVCSVLAARCHKCGLQSGALKQCGACKHVSYCSKECQKADWSHHKSMCGKIEEVE